MKPLTCFSDRMLTLHFSKQEANCALRWQEDNALALATYVLEPWRSLLRKPIIITNWTRTEDHNRAVGGASNSQHLFGQAADCVGDRLDFERLVNSDIVFDQAIYYPLKGFIHVSYSRRRNRRHVLVSLVKKKYIPYAEWRTT